MSKQYVGNIPAKDIAEQVTNTLRIRNIKPAAVMEMDDEQWDELFAASFGAQFGSVRLAVLNELQNRMEVK